MGNLLIKKTHKGIEKVYPKNFILNIFEELSLKPLSEILSMFNMIFLSYTGDKATTRRQVSKLCRHRGLWITYVIDKQIITEWYDSNKIDDYNWGYDINWRIGSNMLIGDIAISSKGTWIIKGIDTGITAQGEKGEKGDSPVIRIYDNKILVSYDKGVTYLDLNNTPVYTKFRFNSQTNTYLVSYDLGDTWLDISDEKIYYKFRYNNTTNTYLVSIDLGLNWTDVSSNKVYYQFRTNDNRLLVSTDLGVTWENCSEPIAAWFKWVDTSGTGNVGKILISRDNETWSDLSPNIINNLYIKGYVSAVGNLPSNAAIGDIYMVGPTYDESDITLDYPHYRMWIKLSSGWIDNGEFTNAGPVGTNNIINGAVTVEKLSSEIIERGKNLFNPNDPDIKIGYYLDRNGNMLANSNNSVSGYIPFSESDGSLVSSFNGRINNGGGFSELYDSKKNRIAGFINSSTGGILKWQEGVAYARFTILTTHVDTIQIEQGEVITLFEPYTENVNIKENLIPELSSLKPVVSSIGNNAKIVQTTSLADSEIFEISEFPWHLKKGMVMSFYALITEFSTLLIGKGYNTYRGSYLKIDTSNITQLFYETSEIQKETIAHGLNIETFIKVSLLSDNLGYLHVILQTKKGLFKYIFKNWAYEANYSPFVMSQGTVLTDLKFCSGCQDFRFPVWAFGDSYFGVTSQRWIGVMKDFGFFNFLIDGLAGQTSSGAYTDLEKCLKYGTPKYLLWCLGMNDSDDNFKLYFDKVKDICNENNITLIAATIPTVPTRNKEVITLYVKDSGFRYIDFYKAVGTNTDGTWYDGYLSTDGVHPTSLGAQALATQVLIDFPELMQYGLTNFETIV